MAFWGKLPSSNALALQDNSLKNLSLIISVTRHRDATLYSPA